MIRLVTQYGLSPAEAIRSILRRVQAQLNMRSGKPMASAMSGIVKAYFKDRYPGSEHWNPAKVGVDEAHSNKNVGTAYVDVPGAKRAYRDVTIRPRFRKFLTIPMHRAAYGMKAADFDDLFRVKAKGKDYLARKQADGSLMFMYALRKRVHQKRNPSIMPSDSNLRTGALESLRPYLDQWFGDAVQSV